MFELEVRRIFSAAHAIVIRGEREPIHGHDWQVPLGARLASLNGLIDPADGLAEGMVGGNARKARLRHQGGQ